MRLIFINRFFFPDESATSQILTDLAFDLVKRGSEVHVVTSRKRHEDPDADLPANEMCCGVHAHRIWTSRFGRGSLAGRVVDYATFHLSALIHLLRIARRGDVIVAETDPPLISLMAAIAARMRGARLVNWLHDIFPEIAAGVGVRAAPGPIGALLRRLRNASLRAASANVVLGERMAERVLAMVPGCASTIHVIENWSDGAVVRAVGRDANTVRAEWDLGDRFVVGYSGNMGRAHEFDTILATCALLRDDTGVAFLFVGAGSQREWVESEALRLDLRNVLFRAFQPRERLASSLSAPDVHLVTLQPALEGLVVPSKVYGVYAVARPTIFIGDPDGEVARMIRRDHSGVAVASGDAHALAEAIYRLRSDPDEVAAMGLLARAALERRYDRPVATARWWALLENVAGVTNR